MAEDVKFRKKSRAVDASFSDVQVLEGGGHARETSRMLSGGERSHRT